MSTAALFGQVVPNRYVVELAGNPAAVGAPRSGMASRRVAVRARQAGTREAIANLGGTVIESMDTVFNGLIVKIPAARVADLSNLPGVLKVHRVFRVRPLLNHALPLHKVPDAWAMLPMGQDSAGAGIKIGMIDTGIDATNPAFSDQLPPLPGFPMVLYDTDMQFTNAKVIVAKNYTPLLPDGGDPDADDRDGHGTGTSMCAAGGSVPSPFGTLTGVAPKAYLGNYKVLDSNGGTSDVIAKAIDDAVADGMDVLNISLGAYVTDYFEVDPTEEVGLAAIEAATQAGVIVAVAAGNEGPGAGTIGDYASAADAISVGAIDNDRTFADAVTPDGGTPIAAVPGNGGDPGTVMTGVLFDVTQVDPTSQMCSLPPPGSLNNMIAVIERGNCNFSTKMNNAAFSGAVGAIIYNNGTASPFGFGGQDVQGARLPTLFIEQADGQALLAQIAANPGLQVTLDFTASAQFPLRTDVVFFSSVGPNLAPAVKPDLVAVGDDIITAAQSTFPDGESYDPTGFIDTAGTSFSTPLVAGSAAVLKAARPGLSMAQYRSLLINSASPATASTTTAATVEQAGAGMLNLASAMNSTIAAYPTSLGFGTGLGTINNALNLTLWNLGTASDTFSINVVPAGNSPAPTLSTNSITIDPNGSQQITATMNASNLAPGAYEGFLQVASTANSGIATIPYWFAVPGSDPATISILYSDFIDPVGSFSSQAVVFRVNDVAGLPYTGDAQPTVTVDAGGGRVRNIYSAGSVPGTYAVDLRLGASTLQLTIQVGNATQDVIIGVF